MNLPSHSQREGALLRERAERLIRMPAPKGGEEELRAAVHELQIHQIELEMQNEELQAAKAQLSELKDRYLDLFDSAPCGYMCFDRRGGVREANLTVSGQLGVERAEVLNASGYSFVHRDDRDALFLHLLKVFERKGGQVVLRMRRGNGFFHAELNSAADFGGSEPLCRSSVVDVSERIRLEQQVLQAKKMESIGVLVGGVAHDFNNLLTVINGYAGILKEELAEEEWPMATGAVERVLTAGERAANLTHNLLAFSRKQIINPCPENVDLLIGASLPAIRRIVGNSVHVETRMPPEAQMACVDRLQLERVLENLADNARDAMPQGGMLRISVESASLSQDELAALELEPGEGYVRIDVEDTGKGIDPEDLDRIFEPFFTTKEVGQGSGLGLSLVYGVVKQHRGGVAVASEPGKGTRFSICLPVWKGEDCPQPEVGTA